MNHKPDLDDFFVQDPDLGVKQHLDYTVSIYELLIET